MTREEAKKLLPIITAFAEGKEVQYRLPGGMSWESVKDNPGFHGMPDNYRIKPEPRVLYGVYSQGGSLFFVGDARGCQNYMDVRELEAILVKFVEELS